MNSTDFEELYRKREARLRALFERKKAQYAGKENVFENNVRAARLTGLSPEKYVLCHVAKHVAVLGQYADRQEPNMDAWRESLDDVAVWMTILEGLLEDK